jgi:hypothetical protein
MRALVVLGFLVVASRAAFADPPGLTQTVPSAPTPIDLIEQHDAGYDRGMVFGSGLVLGRGDVDVSLVSALETGSNLSVGVGIGAGIELSVDGIDALGGRFETLGTNIRLQLAHGPTYAFSVLVGYHWASEEIGGTYLTLGGDLAVALGDTSLLTVGLGFLRATGDDDSFGDSSTNLTAHVALLMGSHMFRPLIELGYIGSPFAFAGVRFASRYVSVDGGIGALSSNGAVDDESGPFAMIGLSLRP